MSDKRSKLKTPAVDPPPKAYADPVAGQILFSIPQTARVLGNLSPRTVWEFIKLGQLPTRLVGRRRLVHVDAIRKFANRDHPCASKEPEVAA